ncbi:MAG: 30S ribosomal protein S6 [Patescibacteria group bacterium]|jgi:small subunit ribosomal protein S6
MAKVKSSKIPEYELLYLIPNKFSENEVPAITEKVNKIITDHEGTVSRTEDWGKKRLAYAIKGQIYGYYQLSQISVGNGKINDIDRLLRLTPEILRHIVIKTDGKKEPKPRPVKAAENEAVRKEKPKPAPKVEETVAKKDASKVDLKDLDEKLDKILEGGDLLK